MLFNFNRDLQIGLSGEQTVKEVLESLTDDYVFTASDNQHRGDIIATNTTTGQKHYIEVKTDSRIGDTGNILCEESVYYYDNGEVAEGFMYRDYEIYCILSKSERKIYVIDFKILHQNYIKNSIKRKILRYPDQESDCFFVQLATIAAAGGLIKVINY